MAVWRSENSLLTVRGEQALSKVLLGVGKLTITRIVIGGGYVPLSQLYKQTQVTNIKQELKIWEVEESSQGAYLKVETNNFNLKESYTVYQLGVYVTHPNFDGEFLYWIAQCDTDTADVIPLPTVLPVNMSYGIFLYNVTSKDMVVTIESSTYITKPWFDDYMDKFLKYVTVPELEAMFTQKP